MPDEMHPVGTEGVDQRFDVADEFGRSVIPAPGRPRTRRVATLIGGNAPITPSSWSWDNGAPTRIELWKAVQQHYHRPVGRAFIDDIEHELTAAVLVHAHSMDQLSDGVVRFAFFGNPGPLCEAIRRGVSAAQNGSGATRRWRTTAMTRSISDTTHAVTAMSRHYWGRVVASDINVFLRRTRVEHQRHPHRRPRGPSLATARIGRPR